MVTRLVLLRDCDEVVLEPEHECTSDILPAFLQGLPSELVDESGDAYVIVDWLGLRGESGPGIICDESGCMSLYLVEGVDLSRFVWVCNRGSVLESGTDDSEVGFLWKLLW